MGDVVADGFGLLYGSLGSGDDELLAFTGNRGLDPEVRGKVGEVGDDSNERSAGANVVPTFVNFAIEVGDDGDQEVGGVFAPEFFEKSDQRLMENADGGLKYAEQGCGAEGPAVLEDDVVLLLNADAGEPSKNVELVGEFLELDQFDLPGTMLLGENRLEGHGGVAVSAARIVEKNAYFFHHRIVTYALCSPRGANGMPC